MTKTESEINLHVSGNTLTLDVVLEADETPETAAQWLLSTPAVRGRAKAKVLEEYGPSGHPVISITADDDLDEAQVKKIHKAVWMRYNGVNVGKYRGKPVIAR